ncbi:hypothetical protein [Phytohabitans houttuyneae]|uniref:Uncharacterized protein n=1 Tax=Phytohabitans houttuyneae TaxID=1076126 RepID=A0A6V8K7I1_9ACTN|nr:hypothetical protein [Phytohabitans houttuyneae]GFJ79480.1 hypothetical protein Phou_036600 [Phytohabitans houttuyneae]
MADTDIGWAHADAIKTMLGGLPYTVYIGGADIPDDADQYLVLWSPPANRPRSTLNGYGGEARTTTQVTAAGRTVREVITALDRVAAALHRQRPTIAGRRCSPITQTPDVPAPPAPEKDPNVRTTDGQPIFFSFLQFSLFSAPEEP